MFKIGDFSKIAQVPVSQLRYYADIGLFAPRQIDPFTSYRYYSASQLPELNRILVLKELGLTLDQIRQAISDDISADEVRGMLRLRQAEIEQTVHEEMQRLRAVQARLRQIEDDAEGGGLEVVMKSVPAQRFLALRKQYSLMSDMLPVVQELLEILPKQFGPKLGYMTAIIHGSSFDLENVDAELGFAIDLDAGDSFRLPSERVLTVRELPAIQTMATVARHGSYENNCRSYGALGAWLEENELSLAAPAREVFLVPPACDDLDSIVVEIQAPVARAAPVARPA